MNSIRTRPRRHEPRSPRIWTSRSWVQAGRASWPPSAEGSRRQRFRNIDLAGDFGGCWYWNRFPGLQCDNEAYCYIPLLEETDFMPTKKYVDGFEIYDQFQRIANQFGLYEGALFHTLVRALRWDDTSALEARAPTGATTSVRASW